MTGKAKPKKHTAAEIARKTALATTNMGGGASGLKDRKGGAVGHSKYVCNICMAPAPDLKSMSTHYENKHPQATFNEADFVDRHELQGGTTVGVAVRGSVKK